MIKEPSPGTAIILQRRLNEVSRNQILYRLTNLFVCDVPYRYTQHARIIIINYFAADILMLTFTGKNTARSRTV